MRHDRGMTSTPLPDVDTVQQELLWCLRYEDDQFLWEVAWSLDCSPEQPQELVDAKISLARRATWELLDRGEIEVWEADGWPPNSYRPVSLAEFRRVEHDDDLWVRPEKATRLFELRVVSDETESPGLSP
jgi:hypothetical protein